MMYQSAWDKLMDGDWLDAILDPFLGAMGPLFVAIVVLAIMGVLYVDVGDITLPAIVAILAGGLVVEYAPPVVAQAGILIVLLGATLAVARVYLMSSSRR